MRTLRFLILAACMALPPAALAADGLMMATSAGARDSGLLDYLKPFLLREAGVDLTWVSSGAGEALEHGKNCDVDVLLVDAPAAEMKMVEEGFAVVRREVMYSDFVFVGPGNDPAGIRGKSAADALKTLVARKAVFVSGGDASGAHQVEQRLWTSLKMPVPVKENWYVRPGRGMTAAISTAAEKRGYALAERSAWLRFEAAQKDHNPLAVLIEGDTSLRNQYSVIIVNPARCPKLRAGAAGRFADWWVSAAAQDHIACFRLEGRQLFFPNAAPPSR